MDNKSFKTSIFVLKIRSWNIFVAVVNEANLEKVKNSFYDKIINESAEQRGYLILRFIYTSDCAFALRFGQGTPTVGEGSIQ